MKFVLYRYKETPNGRIVQYVKDIKNRKVTFSTHTYHARRFSLIKAIFLAIRYQLFWIQDKYLHNRS